MAITQLRRQYSPFEQMLPQFLSNLIFQQMSQRFQTTRDERREERADDRELRDTLRSGQYEKAPITSRRDPDLTVAGQPLREIPQMLGQMRIGGTDVMVRRRGDKIEAMKVMPKAKDPALIQQYNLARSQGYGKSFTDWRKEMARAGATNINIGEKVKLHTEKLEATKRVNVKAMVSSPQFRTKVQKDLKSIYSGTGRDWEYLEDYEREEMTFREMDRQIKEAYPKQNIVFDEERGGWFDARTGKIIKKYEDPFQTKRKVRKHLRGLSGSPLEGYLNR